MKEIRSTTKTAQGVWIASQEKQSDEAGIILDAIRTPLKLIADPKRVIARLFLPGDPARIEGIIQRILSLDAGAVRARLDATLRDFSFRHKHIEQIFHSHYLDVSRFLSNGRKLSREQQLLIGAYFTLEYSLESVALFNPSIVPHPDQCGLDPNEIRFVMSLRACGEGHISSIEFRSGVLRANHEISLDPITPFAIAEKPVEDKRYEKHTFFLKLIEMAAYDENTQVVLDRLGDTFTLVDLDGVMAALRAEFGHSPHFEETAEKILWLAHSNYSLHFSDHASISERVIFPVNENDSRGIEDARFVRFTREDGSSTYYATYTAYNGFTILPQIIETEDFQRFKIITLNGKYVQNKGMAIFPRMIDGEYYMLSRLDGEHLFMMHSDNLHFWNEASKMNWKRQPWEFMQVGNCGSPLETKDGWLLLTHGVGPMRRYCIGAALLDLNDPSRVIATLPEPLIEPSASERDGYVPNVVYTCGGMIHQDELIIPYSVSDTRTGFAVVSLPDLLARLSPTD